MNKFEIENNPSIEDIKQMIKLDAMAFDEKDRGVLERCLLWQKICPELYTILKDKDKVVGYINFLPITKGCFEKFKKGHMKDYLLKPSDILPFQKGKNYCLFMSIVIREEFRDTEAINILLRAFQNKIEKLKDKNVVIHKVIVDCVTPDGEKLIKERFKSKLLCQTETGSKIYEFSV